VRDAWFCVYACVCVCVCVCSMAKRLCIDLPEAQEGMWLSEMCVVLCVCMFVCVQKE
jgi:hypothetical protein